MTSEQDRRGFSVVEAVIVVAIVAFFVLAFLVMLPRRREVARNAACQRNLMQIGVALVLYDRAAGHLPGIPRLENGSRGDGPLKALVETLGLPDLTALDNPATPPPRLPGFSVREQPIAGWICPSDRTDVVGVFPAPVSYRAATGDTPDGQGGAFAPGRQISLADVESGDGTGYTAAFSERLIGNNQTTPALANYAVVPGPVPEAGCPEAAPGAWKGDAGWTWFAAEWRSTIYNHTMPPNSSPSCIADDRRSAMMGASSSHPGTVNVLIFDGSVRTVTATIEPRIWRQLATIAPAQPAAQGP